MCRVELYFNFGDKDTNKTKFDFLYSMKDEIQSAMPEFSLVWERLDDKVTCRVKTQKDISYLDEAVVPEVMNFLLSGSCKFLEVFSKYNKQIAKA